jgi:hypothetical protein
VYFAPGSAIAARAAARHDNDRKAARARRPNELCWRRDPTLTNGRRCGDAAFATRGRQKTIAIIDNRYRALERSHDMPNDVEIVCQLAGSITAIAIFKLAHIKMLNDAPMLDFETVIPMPASVRETERSWDVDLCIFALGCEKTSLYRNASLEENWFAKKGMTARSEILAWVEENMAHGLAAARRSILAQAETGCPDWYQWSVQNWGTKWNSYWFAWLSPEPITFSFCTAWSFPHPIFAKLAELHPELTFDCSYVDEMGNFDGRSVYCNGTFDEGASWYREPAGDGTDEDIESKN